MVLANTKSTNQVKNENQRQKKDKLLKQDSKYIRLNETIARGTTTEPITEPITEVSC